MNNSICTSVLCILCAVNAFSQTLGTPIDYLPDGVKLQSMFRGLDSNTIVVEWEVDSVYLSQNTDFTFQVCLENHMDDSVFSQTRTVSLDSVFVLDTVLLYHDYYLHELVYNGNIITRFNYANKSPHLFEDWEHRYPRYRRLSKAYISAIDHTYSYQNNEGVVYGYLNTFEYIPWIFLIHPIQIHNSFPSSTFPWGWNNYLKFQNFWASSNGNLINATSCDTVITYNGFTQNFFPNSPAGETFIKEIGNISIENNDMFYSIEYYKWNEIFPNMIDSTIDIFGYLKAEFGPSPSYNFPNVREDDIYLVQTIDVDFNQSVTTYEKIHGSIDTLLKLLPFNPYHFNDNLKYCPHVVDSVCLLDGYEINGEMVYQEGLYFDSLLTAWGTDSILARQLHLKIPEEMDTANAMFCTGDTFFFGGYLFTDSGNYYLDTNQSLACDTGILLHLSEENVQTGVAYDALNYTVYTTVSTINGDFQWYNQDGTPIAGATSNGYQVTENGVYYCVITGENCMFTTESIEVVGLGIEEWNPHSLTLYPNPVYDQLHIESEESFSQVVVYNAMGQIVYSLDQTHINTIVDMSTFSNGMYTLKIQLESGVLVQRNILKM